MSECYSYHIDIHFILECVSRYNQQWNRLWLDHRSEKWMINRPCNLEVIPIIRQHNYLIYIYSQSHTEPPELPQTLVIPYNHTVFS